MMLRVKVSKKGEPTIVSGDNVRVYTKDGTELHGIRVLELIIGVGEPNIVRLECVCEVENDD